MSTSSDSKIVLISSVSLRTMASTRAVNGECKQKRSVDNVLNNNSSDHEGLNSSLKVTCMTGLVVCFIIFWLTSQGVH